MTLPVTIPNTFANATSSIPLSQLDANFSTLSNVINQINAGTQAVANLTSSNVTITGGTIANVTLDNVTVDVETLSNVTINGGNVTVTNMVATTANATTGNITTVNATTIDTTNIEVTNIKAKDGTAALSIADSTGVTTQSTPAVISVNSSSDALRITQTGAGNALVVEDSTNPDSTPFVVDASGRTYVGNTTSYAVGLTDTPLFQISTTNASTAQASVGAYNNAAAAGKFTFVKSRSGTNGTLGGIVASGDAIGTIAWRGDDGVGANPIQAAALFAEVDGTPGTNDMPGRLVFSTTADGASSPTERMRIDSSGQVTIGGTATAGQNVRVAKNITGSTTGRGVLVTSTVQSDVTSVAYGYSTFLGTQATSFTLVSLSHYHAQQGTIGATSTATNQYGFAADSSLTGATNNYGFYSNIASGTGRWNFYANGTAENYLGGNLKIGGTAARGTTAGTNHLSLFNGTAPAGTLTNGVTMYSSSGDLNFMDAAGNGYKVGYRNVPAVGTKTGSYTLAVGDVGKYVQVGSGGSITIPDATFAEGDIVSVFNNTSGNITITCSITTAYIAGTDADKASVTLATRGVATILFISGTVCVISGNVS